MAVIALLLTMIPRLAVAQCPDVGNQKSCAVSAQPGETLSPSLLQKSSFDMSGDDALPTLSPHERAGSQEGVLMAGDEIYLKCPNPDQEVYVEVKQGKVTCTGTKSGAQSTFILEKKMGGGIHQWDTIYLKSYEDKYLGVDDYKVSADWVGPTDDEINDFLEKEASLAQSKTAKSGKGKGPSNPWDPFKEDPDSLMPGDIQIAFHMDKNFTVGDYNYQTDVIRVGDAIFLRAYSTHYLSVNGDKVEAKGDVDTIDADAKLKGKTGAKFIIERHETESPPSTPPPGPELSENVIMAGEQVFFRAHTGKHLAIPMYGDPTSNVKCMFDERGDRQKMILEKVEGGAIHSGDEVYIKDSNGYHLEVGGQVGSGDFCSVCTRRIPFGEKNDWLIESQTSWLDGDDDCMKFVIEKDTDGVVQENDTVYLKSCTGTYVYVYRDWCPLINDYVFIGGADRKKGVYAADGLTLHDHKWGAGWEFIIERGNAPGTIQDPPTMPPITTSKPASGKGGKAASGKGGKPASGKGSSGSKARKSRKGGNYDFR